MIDWIWFIHFSLKKSIRLWIHTFLTLVSYVILQTPVFTYIRYDELTGWPQKQKRAKKPTLQYVQTYRSVFIFYCAPTTNDR